VCDKVQISHNAHVRNQIKFNWEAEASKIIVYISGIPSVCQCWCWCGFPSIAVENMQTEWKTREQSASVELEKSNSHWGHAEVSRTRKR